MESLEEVLNCIGDFSCYISDELVSFSGILNDEKGNAVLRCKMRTEWYQKINHHSSVHMWGNVNSIPVSFLNVYLKDGAQRDGENYISLTFIPSEIVIGQSSSTEIQVTQMTMSISALNNMFSTSPLQSIHSFSKDNPSLLNYTYPNAIEANDKYGYLRIYQTFREIWDHNTISYKISPIIDYQFHHPLEIMDAVAKMAAARNLFTFFANHYLPFENITFIQKNWSTISNRSTQIIIWRVRLRAK